MSSSFDGTAKVWAMPACTKLNVMTGHVGAVYGTDISPGGFSVRVAPLGRAWKRSGATTSCPVPNGVVVPPVWSLYPLFLFGRWPRACRAHLRCSCLDERSSRSYLQVSIVAMPMTSCRDAHVCVRNTLCRFQVRRYCWQGQIF